VFFFLSLVDFLHNLGITSLFDLEEKVSGLLMALERPTGPVRGLVSSNRCINQILKECCVNIGLSDSCRDCNKTVFKKMVHLFYYFKIIGNMSKLLIGNVANIIKTLPGA
jgi:hypothetical protein